MFYGKKEMTQVGLTKSHEFFKSRELFPSGCRGQSHRIPKYVKGLMYHCWLEDGGDHLARNEGQPLEMESFPLLIDSKEMAPQAHIHQELSPANILRELGN